MVKIECYLFTTILHQNNSNLDCCFFLLRIWMRQVKIVKTGNLENRLPVSIIV